MRPDLLLLAAELVKKGEPFALAVVVRREPATSARVGDLALVTEGGRFHGWLGGSCTQPTLVREVRQALATACPGWSRFPPIPAPTAGRASSPSPSPARAEAAWTSTSSRSSPRRG